jgi:uncharacterized RDD family membrane protein YckC
MEEQFVISTPEQVAFHYETAGLGSRFVAALIDHLILGLVLTLLNFAVFMLIPAFITSSFEGNNDGGTVMLVLALVVLINFLVLFGYFLLFETVWKGQTPGKRQGRLRVLKRNGEPIGAGEAAIRNLVRLVDFLPGFYGIGLVVMFADKEVRRLGDFAAGTIVVREAEQVGLRDVRVATGATTPIYSGGGAAGTGGSAGYYPQKYDPLPGVSLRELGPDDYRLIREVVERARRGEMQKENAADLALRTAYGVAHRIGHDFREWQSRGWLPVVFLESVLNARDARGQ